LGRAQLVDGWSDGVDSRRIFQSERPIRDIQNMTSPVPCFARTEIPPKTPPVRSDGGIKWEELRRAHPQVVIDCLRYWWCTCWHRGHAAVAASPAVYLVDLADRP